MSRLRSPLTNLFLPRLTLALLTSGSSFLPRNRIFYPVSDGKLPEAHAKSSKMKGNLIHNVS